MGNPFRQTVDEAMRRVQEIRERWRQQADAPLASASVPPPQQMQPAWNGSGINAQQYEQLAQAMAQLPKPKTRQQLIDEQKTGEPLWDAIRKVAIAEGASHDHIIARIAKRLPPDVLADVVEMLDVQAESALALKPEPPAASPSLNDLLQNALQLQRQQPIARTGPMTATVFQGLIPKVIVALVLALPLVANAVQIDPLAYMTNSGPSPSCIVDRPEFCETTGWISPSRMVAVRSDGLTGSSEAHSGWWNVRSDGYRSAFRVFGDGRLDDKATYGPLALPVAGFDAPSLTGIPDIRAVTPGGRALYTFKRFFVNPVDASTCHIAAGDPLVHSAWAFTLPSYDFGGNIGPQTDVLVLEDVSGYAAGESDPTRGFRLERYLFARGLGVRRQEGWGCSSATGCTYYDATPNGYSVTFATTYGDQLPLAEFCPTIVGVSTPAPAPTPTPTPQQQGLTISGFASISGTTLRGAAQDSARPASELWINAWIGPRGQGVNLGDVATQQHAFSYSLAGAHSGQVIYVYVIAYVPWSAVTPVLIGKVVVP